MAKCFQGGPKWGPETAFEVQFELGTASKPQLNSKTSAIWDPKLVPKSTRKLSKIDLESDFETLVFDTNVGPIFDRFSSRGKEIFDPN